ncbi:MAG: NAD(P)-dependent alcohol dehydrogenase [Lachnospiraceae bacterium]|nr:NAD(P)-dependent alcohol dehydrogenase [Lachnospiraceae bacterium]
MKGKMKVAEMPKARQIVLVERDIPQLNADELLIRLEYVGICGSDLHFYEDGRLGNWVAEEPLVLGHEPGGVVAEIGSGVTGFAVGDRVALEPGVPCGVCETCKKGTYNLCKRMSFMAIPKERAGVFSEYCAHPANMCYKLPDHVSTLEGALMEPLAVGLHALDLADVKVGQSAVVLGCGCIGLVTIMALKAAGVDEIYAVDVIPKRLEKAKEVGALQVFDGKKENVTDIIQTLSRGGTDHVFETAGTEFTTLQSAKLVGNAGVVTIIGMCSDPEVKVDLGSLSEKEGTLKTIFRYRNLYPMAIKLVSQGKMDLSSIVSHEFSLDEISKAIAYNINNKDDVIKAVIKM